MKKIFLAPIITLILNALYEIWHTKHYYPDSPITFTSWNIIFLTISLLLAVFIHFYKKMAE